MSIETGCVCTRCLKWHSHVKVVGNKYICVNCFKRGLDGKREKQIRFN